MPGLFNSVVAALSTATLSGATAFGKALRDDKQKRSKAPPDTDEALAQKPASDAKSVFYDPFLGLDMGGYQQRPSSIGFDTLRNIYTRLPIVSSVVNARVNQVAAFATPVRNRYDMGFRIRLRDEHRTPDEETRQTAAKLERFMLETGVTDNPRGRDNFEGYLRKVTRDSLLYDQDCTEIVPSKLGTPAAFWSVDSTTMRLAVQPAQGDAKYSVPELDEDEVRTVRYVQVVNNVVINEYSQDEMIFGVRNVDSNIALMGYGTSELELLLPTITSLLNALQYNSLVFSQGTMAKGILNLKENIPADKFNAFKRDWYSMLRGEQNAHRVPIMQAPAGLEWINLQQNTDMQFREWVDYLIKVVCSGYSMDPSEINLKYGSVGQSAAMSEENNRDKLTESRERGLRPLLRHIANNLNQYIIWPLSRDFSLEFVGLDSMSRGDLADYNLKRVKCSTTVNELRAEDDKPPLPGGDTLLDQSFLQAVGMVQPDAQQYAQPPADDGVDADDAQPQPDADPSDAQGPPDATQKSLTPPKPLLLTIEV